MEPAGRMAWRQHAAIQSHGQHFPVDKTIGTPPAAFRADSKKGTAMPQTQTAAERVKLNRQLAQMLKGGVIMDVTTPEQAHIAEEAGACAVMALEPTR